jgi:xanthine dehydrogenase iron-sulfur cluster and FAD-binding subunit A
MASCATLWFNISMWTEYITPASLKETLDLLAQKREKSRIIAGATDLMLELERGVRRELLTLVDITRLPDLDQILIDEDEIIHLGPLVTHNVVVSSRLLRERAFPLVSASWQVGAPQIRNRATVAGNIVTASPANDTITPLMALGAWVELASIKGTRRVPLEDFYTGVRKSVLQPDEILVDIAFPALKTGQRGTFLKLGLRRVQAISLVNVAVVLTLDNLQVRSAVITLGAVAPTIIHAHDAEGYLVGKDLSEETISRTADLAAGASKPIDDIRGSAAYRKAMVRVLVMRALRILLTGQENNQIPETPVLLWGQQGIEYKPSSFVQTIPDGDHPLVEKSIHTIINHKEYIFSSGYEKSLLRLLREDAGLTGTKEGCAEGECGACTVFLDGKAVMACLVPAPRANKAEIITVEGLSERDDSGKMVEKIHPVQRAFIAGSAVQCGYCTPGFIMSAVKLLEEQPHPDRNDITQAISGNLCRCTGYYNIVKAIEDAAKY